MTAAAVHLLASLCLIAIDDRELGYALLAVGACSNPLLAPVIPVALAGLYVWIRTRAQVDAAEARSVGVAFLLSLGTAAALRLWAPPPGDVRLPDLTAHAAVVVLNVAARVGMQMTLSAAPGLIAIAWLARRRPAPWAEVARLCTGLTLAGVGCYAILFPALGHGDLANLPYLVWQIPVLTLGGVALLAAAGSDGASWIVRMASASVIAWGCYATFVRDDLSWLGPTYTWTQAAPPPSTWTSCRGSPRSPETGCRGVTCARTQATYGP